MKQPQLFNLLILCLFFFACQNTDPKTSNEAESKAPSNTVSKWLAVPGERVGKITPNMSEADLIAAYGKDQVKRDSLHVGEGYFIQSTVVFPNTPNELRIAWAEGKTFEKITRIIIRQDGAQWQTSKGLRIGDSLQKVVELNDVDFNFWGFDWDYAGSVSSWEGGNFDGKGLGVRLNYRTAIEKLDKNAIGSITGEQEVSSSEAILEEMDVYVSEMFFYFPD